MSPLAESSAHPRSQTYTGFAELVAQAVCRCHRVFPTLLAVAFKQVDLIGLRSERGCLHAQKSNRHALFPISAEQRAHLLENFRVELGWGRQGMGASECGEIFVAQFELNGARVKPGFAQAAGHHLRKTRQCRLQLGEIGGVFVVGVFVADGFGIRIGSNFSVEPSTCIFAAGLPRQGQAPFSKTIVQFGFVEASQVSDFFDAEGVQVTFHDLADSGDFTHVERR